MGAIVKTIAPIDSLSGMIGNRNTYISETAFICNIKKMSARFGGRPYMFMSVRKNDRKSKFTQDELLNQDKFSEVAKQTRAAMKDPGQVMQLQAEFKAQSTYKTFYQFVWRKKWNAYTE